MKYFFNRLKDVKLKDVFSVFPCIAAYIYVKLYGKKFKNIWLICEEKEEARDNGYWLFKYICENQKAQKVVYAIDFESKDYERVKKIGDCIPYGSLKHWIYYFGSSINISSQKGGKPNAALCYLLEIYGFHKNIRVFLQHGIVINDLKWLYYDVTKFNLFICAIREEYEFILRNFHYPNEVLKLTGLCRFDNLHDFKVIDNKILIMPTWRAWFRLKSKNDGKINVDFKTSKYLKSWKSFLKSNGLKELVDKYKLDVNFYPHRNMQCYLDLFYDLPEYIKVIDAKNVDIQEELKNSALLITDYSSVFFDFVYMRKPVLFYQFDKDEFRSYQYQEGWFDYENNDVSLYAESEFNLLKNLKIYCDNEFQVSQKFLEKHKDYFEYFDNKNCERVYHCIKKLGEIKNDY